MKKTVIVIMLAAVCCAVLFARQQVSLTMHPYTFQAITGKDSGDEQSTYGIGGGLGYETEITQFGIKVGADVYGDTYFIKDRENFTDVSFMGKVGYDWNIDCVVTPYGYLKYGLDLQAFEGLTSAVQVFGTELGGSYRINDKIAVKAGAEGLFSFPKTEDVNYANYRVNGILGVSYSL